MKNDYEQIIAPTLFNQISSLNNSYINNIREQIARFKEEVDSDDFKFIDFLHNTSPNPHRVSRWPLMVFLFSAFVCLSCSTLFHLFYPMSSSNFELNFRVIHDIQ
jgi:adiponectin receptor